MGKEEIQETKKTNTIGEIVDYCNEPNTIGAFLITGKWGCGKTYLIENELRNYPGIKENFIIVRVSMFGEDSLEAIKRKVKLNILYARIPSGKNESKKDRENKEKGIKVAATVAKVAAKTWGAIKPAGQAAGAVLSVDITDFCDIKNKYNKKSVLLIFDDLERSKLPPADLLGCINEFVENYQIKTIIIANEEEIKKSNGHAKTDDKTKAEEPKNTQDDKQAKRTLSKYDELKEKVVSRTVRLKPDYKSIIAQIVEKQEYENVGYKAFLENRKVLIEQIFIESKTENIRSLKCALQGFERVYKITSDQKISDDATENFFSAYLCMVFEHKRGNLEKHERYGCILPITQMGEVYTAFQSRHVLSSVLDWIVDGTWEEQSIIAEVQILGKDKGSATPSEILLMSPVLSLTDEQLKDGFDEALKRGYSGDLSLNDYMDLLKRLVNCRELEIKPLIDIDYARLIDGLEKRIDEAIKEELESKRFNTFFDSSVFENLNAEEKTLYEKLDDFSNNGYLLKYKYKFVKAYTERNEQKIIDFNSDTNYYFDREMAEAIFDFYNNSEKGSRFQFVLYFCRKYKNTFFAKKQEYEDSNNTMKWLKKQIENTYREQETEKALDRLFAKEIGIIVEKLSANILSMDSDKSIQIIPDEPKI